MFHPLEQINPATQSVDVDDTLSDKQKGEAASLPKPQTSNRRDINEYF